MDIRGISVVSVQVNDMERARHFYEHVLGLAEPYAYREDWAEYELPGSHFALYRSRSRATPTQLPASGGQRFCFEVGDIAAAHKELTKAGVDIHFGPKEEHGYHLLEFEDIDGNPIRLIQYEG